MIRRPPRSTLSSSSAASDVYKRQVAVVRLVVDHHDVPLVAELAAHAADHLVGGLGEGALRGGVAAGQQALGQPAGRDLLAQQEGVKVGDHDLGAVEPVHQFETVSY